MQNDIQTVSIIIPVYNEKTTLREILKRVQNVDLGKIRKEIILIDDKSTDGTTQVLKEMNASENIKILYHTENKGKGATLRTGFKEASGDIFIIQDADLEYNPGEYPKLLEPLLEGKADLVFGSRFLSGPHRALFFWHYYGNKFLTFLTNMVSDLCLTDMETCYKVFKKEVVQSITLKSNRFGFEPEFTIKAARKGFRFYEVPISYDSRNYREGKKITWKDGIAAIFTIFRSRFF